MKPWLRNFLIACPLVFACATYIWHAVTLFRALEDASGPWGFELQPVLVYALFPAAVALLYAVQFSALLAVVYLLIRRARLHLRRRPSVDPAPPTP